MDILVVSIEHHGGGTTTFEVPEGTSLGKVINLAIQITKGNTNVKTVAIMSHGTLLACYDGADWR